MKRILSVDLETYSSVPLGDCGVYRYCESPDFEILLLGYAYDDEPVQVIDLTREEIPSSLRQDILHNPDVVKSGWNVSFEITCFSRYLGQQLDPAEWSDSMIMAAELGLPRSLKDVGIALNLGHDEVKDRRGKALIRFFSVPCAPTKANNGRTRNLPTDDPEKWAEYIEYNRQDVVAERAIRKKISGYPLEKSEQTAWVFDQGINSRGVLCDRKLAEQAVRMSNEHTEALMQELKEITGLENPNSLIQLKSWLGMEGPLDKATVSDLLEKETDPQKRRALEIRREIGKSSVKKYTSMLNYMCGDDRCRGLFQFYGANRTGRFAGRGVQLQNLPQNHIEDLTTARNLVLEGDRESVELLFGNVPDTLSQLIRTAFIPKKGCTFAVADFSAIEARVIAWLAGEEWRMRTFKEGKDIYCASASAMFHVPVVKHGVNGHLRQKGKIAELALGYGGSAGAMINMGAIKMGLTEEELPEIVEKWREASPNIVELWYEIGNAVMDAVKYREHVKLHHGIEVWRTGKLLHMRLPSGRCIRYFDPHVTQNRFGHDSIGYQAYDAGKWDTAETWGGKLVENLVQATARDCLLVSMQRVAKRYPDIVMHVHDEMIVEVPSAEAKEALQFICQEMGREIPWAPGLLLRGDGYLCDYYKKD